MNRLGLGLAVGAGYVLGRTKKMKLAFAVGTMVAGKRMHLSPRALGELVTQQLQNNPQFKEIGDQLRQDLRGVGKAASGALVERQITGLADRLHGRTAQVKDQLAGVVPDDEYEDDEYQEDEYEEDDERADEDDERGEGEGEAEAGGGGGEERPRERKRAPAKKAPAKKAPAKKAPAKKAAEKRSPATKTPAKKASAKKAPAKKTAAKKTAATAAKKAPAKKTAAAKTAGRRVPRARTTRGGGDDD